MKKERWESISPFDKKIDYGYKYYLTDEEKNHFRCILKNFDQSNVETFIERIQCELTHTREIIDNLNQRSPSDHIAKLTGIKSRIDASLKDVSQIADCRFKVDLPRHCNHIVESLLDQENARHKIPRKILRDAALAKDILAKLVDNLGSLIALEKRKPGQHMGADEFNLAYQVAYWFTTYIDVPHPHSGPFAEIVGYCFNICEIKGDDRSRAIRCALDKLSSQFPLLRCI